MERFLVLYDSIPWSLNFESGFKELKNSQCNPIDTISCKSIITFCIFHSFFRIQIVHFY